MFAHLCWAVPVAPPAEVLGSSGLLRGFPLARLLGQAAGATLPRFPCIVRLTAPCSLHLNKGGSLPEVHPWEGMRHLGEDPAGW